MAHAGTGLATHNRHDAREEVSFMEEHTREQIQIRQVTQVRSAWTEEERGTPGTFTFQLILDNGAEEYVLRPTAEDARVLLLLWQNSANVTFDLKRKVLIFGETSL